MRLSLSPACLPYDQLLPASLGLLAYRVTHTACWKTSSRKPHLDLGKCKYLHLARPWPRKGKTGRQSTAEQHQATVLPVLLPSVNTWNQWVKGFPHCASYGSTSCESIFHLMLHNSLLVGTGFTVTLWEFWLP